jgi:hypothetical protein
MLAGGVQDDDVCLLAVHRLTDAVPDRPVTTADLSHPGAVVPPPADPLPGPVAWAA